MTLKAKYVLRPQKQVGERLKISMCLWYEKVFKKIGLQNKILILRPKVPTGTFLALKAKQVASVFLSSNFIQHYNNANFGDNFILQFLI